MQKLYAMVRNSKSWEYGEADLNHADFPVTHDITQKLGCIRHHRDIDLPVQMGLP